MSDPKPPPEEAASAAEDPTVETPQAEAPQAVAPPVEAPTDTNEIPVQADAAADDPAMTAEPVPPPPLPVANPAPYETGGQVGPPGKIRGTGACIGLTIITLGFYTWYWWYNVHKEMKEHSGTGIGGGVALVLAIFVNIVNAFLTPNEVGGLYTRRGQSAPVSAIWGLWWLLPLVGPIIWFVKTNGALNDYWVSQGAARS